jgi:DNA-binding Xre family transcriptional regulator
MYARGSRKVSTMAQRLILKMLRDQGMDDFSQSQLGKRWGESSAAVGNFLRNPEAVQLSTARRFCKHLGCTLNDVYEPTNDIYESTNGKNKS